MAYPKGGGAYVVTRENLGRYPSLVAGAALLIDYVLTVAVSINQTALLIKGALLFRKGVIVTNVPYHLER